MIDVRIGDSRNLIKDVEDRFADCVVTSPPYWGLRDYGHDDQIGLESTPEKYIETMIALFDNIKLKLKDTGNCFVNLGDTYAANRGYQVDGTKQRNGSQPNTGMSINKCGVPEKCLCMIPERFAWGMIEHGWILRNKVVWWKPNHMPESMTDRLTKSYEFVFHFVKQQNYYYDLDAIREPIKQASIERMQRGISGNHKYSILPEYAGGGGLNHPRLNVKKESKRGYQGKFDGFDNVESFGSPRARTQRKPYAIADRDKEFVEYRDNLPSLVEIRAYLCDSKEGTTVDEVETAFGNQAPHHWFSGECYPSAEDWMKLKGILGFDDTFDHRMTDVKFKSSEKVNNPKGKNPGDCLKVKDEYTADDIISAWAQMHPEDWDNPGDFWSINTKPYTKAHFAAFPIELIRRPILAGCPVGGMVLDPFGGKGTVAEFCRKNDRDCTIFELNQEYEPLIIESGMVDTLSLDSYSTGTAPEE